MPVPHSKNDRGLRPAVNLKRLNKYIPPTFSKWTRYTCTCTEELKCIEENNWLMKVDMKDAHLIIPIHNTD